MLGLCCFHEFKKYKQRQGYLHSIHNVHPILGHEQIHNREHGFGLKDEFGQVRLPAELCLVSHNYNHEILTPETINALSRNYKRLQSSFRLQPKTIV